MAARATVRRSRNRRRRCTAYHEAGHAVAALRLFGGFDVVYLCAKFSDRKPDYKDGACVGGPFAPVHAVDLGYYPEAEHERLSGEVMNEMIYLFAGPAAEAKHRKCSMLLAVVGGGLQDLEAFEDLLAWCEVKAENDRRAYQHEAKRLAREFVRENWSAISTLAETLIERGAVHGDDPLVRSL